MVPIGPSPVKAAIRPGLRRIVLAAVLALALLAPGGVQAEELDFPVPGGHFYKQANGSGGAGSNGFAVVDGGADVNGNGIPLYSAYLELGGPSVWGFPISNRFRFGADDPFVYQAFQNGLLQWDPANRILRPANLMDMLSDAGYDPLLETWGYPQRQDDSSAGILDAARAERLGWLEDGGYPDLRASYYSRGELVLGLPGAPPQTFGWIRALRTQRSVLATYNDGPVQMASSGDDAKRIGFLNGDPLIAKGTSPSETLTATVMIAQSAAGATAGISDSPKTQYQWRVEYTTVEANCERTLLYGDVRDAYGIPRDGVWFRTWNAEGNEVFFISGVDQPISGTWIRDMGFGIHPGVWNIEIVEGVGAAKLSETAIVRFTDTCTGPDAVNIITVFFRENPPGAITGP